MDRQGGCYVMSMSLMKGNILNIIGIIRERMGHESFQRKRKRDWLSKENNNYFRNLLKLKDHFL